MNICVGQNAPSRWSSEGRIVAVNFQCFKRKEGQSAWETFLLSAIQLVDNQYIEMHFLWVNAADFRALKLFTPQKIILLCGANL